MNTWQVSRRLGWSSLWQLVAIWAFLRLLTSFWVAAVSPLRPLTAIEKSVALWPPAGSFALWLERVFLAPWHRWDATYYISIVLHGYGSDDGTTSFHPLLPWLARPFFALTGHPLLGLLLVSSLAALGTIIAFSRLAALAARGRSTFSELRRYAPVAAAMATLTPTFGAERPQSV